MVSIRTGWSGSVILYRSMINSTSLTLSCKASAHFLSTFRLKVLSLSPIMTLPLEPIAPPREDRLPIMVTLDNFLAKSKAAA